MQVHSFSLNYISNIVENGSFDPVLTPRGAPFPLSAELIISICYQVYGDVLRINFRGLKWNSIQFSWVTFQVLMEMGHLTPAWPLWGYFSTPIRDICIYRL